MFQESGNQVLSFPKCILSSVQLMQNKDYYQIPTKGLILSAHNRTKIQNAPLSFSFEKLKSCWQHSTKFKCIVPFSALNPIYSFTLFPK